NESSFRTCRRLLAQRGQVALFPEGISHDESMLQPLKTGAARIALGAAVDDGVPGVVVVPVGLSYDAKAIPVACPYACRSGTGRRPVGRWLPGRPASGGAAMTAELAERLSAV